MLRSFCHSRFNATLALIGGSGVQSSLDPAGREAERIAALFWWMTGGTVVIWLSMVALAFYAIHARPEAHTEKRARLFIIGGGALVPTVVLGGLLTYGLSMLPDLIAKAPDGSLRIAVTGEQWWWRVRYVLPEGGEVVTANEIRLPVGEPVQFDLDSPDVIHSFWIPTIGGKMDMIPGRQTRLVLHPTRTGTFRGVCAEYCGASHTYMAFYAVVMEKADFKRWLEEQRQPAAEPVDPLTKQGREHFLANGCSACHTVRGIGADGLVGPDLTHLGSRLSLGAGFLPNDLETLTRWIARTNEVKPGVHMPHFRMLPADELHALAAYLASLK
ncbi:MAG TPA: cytochrome c oxidase subunit II [Verrucomicrobiales bacterium]|nr:cytochrome c oxidase subunit II [Verrucomicrobiales bacterium]